MSPSEVREPEEAHSNAGVTEGAGVTAPLSEEAAERPLADVFISYAREDRDQAERLARALEAEGLGVWWDEESLRSSESFSESINRALDAVKRVVVLWSPHSIASHWVDAEALHAWDAGKLHSVWLTQDAPVRVPFNASHARNLSDWDGNPEYPEFRRLVDDIRALSAASGQAAGQVGTSANKAAAGGRRRVLVKLLWLAAPTVLALAVAVSLMQWHRDSRVALAVTVDRVAMTVAPNAGGGLSELMDSGQVRLVHAEGVGRVVFEADALEVADEGRYDLKTGRFPADAWTPLTVTGETALEPLPGAAWPQPDVILQSDDPAVAASLNHVVRAPAGSAVVIWPSPEADMQPGAHPAPISVELAASGAQVDLVFPPGRMLVLANAMRLAGAAGAGGTVDALSLRVHRQAANTTFSILGSERGLVLHVEPADKAETLLTKGQIPISAVDFTDQTPTGERRSTLIGPGELRYPDLPGKAPLALEANDFVNLGQLKQAAIKSLSIDQAAGRNGLRLTLDAVAARVRVGTHGHPRDARLTWFDWLWYQPSVRTLFAIVLWFITTTFAGYKLWQELRSSRASS